MEILRRSQDATSSELVLAYNLRFSEDFVKRGRDFVYFLACCGGDDLRPFWPKIIADLGFQRS
jgi:hypothetical protein